MNVEEIISELGVFDDDKPVYVEINGVAHRIHSVTDDSQGVYLTVDSALEEREMRP